MFNFTCGKLAPPPRWYNIEKAWNLFLLILSNEAPE